LAFARLNSALCKSAANRFVHGVADTLNPVTVAQGIAGMVTDPMKNVFAPMVVNRVKADEADKQGRTSEAMGYRAGGILPLVGPMAVNIGEQAGSGDIAGAAGALTGLAVAPKVYGNAFKAAAPVVESTVGTARRVAPIVGQVAKELAPEAAGAIAGAAVSGPIGGVVGGVLGRSAKNAVIKVLRRTQNLSETEAGKIADRIPIDTAQTIAKTDRLPAGFDMTAKSAGGPPVTSEQLAAAPSDLESLGFKLKPIPTSKLPVRLPDPEVPELNMKAKVQQGFEKAKAAQAEAKAPTYTDEAAARAARQKEHIAESYRQKAAKDAKNVAEEDNLEQRLKESIEATKPGAKPSGEAAQIAKDLSQRIRDLASKQGMSRGQIIDILEQNHGIPKRFGAQMYDMVTRGKS